MRGGPLQHKTVFVSDFFCLLTQEHTHKHRQADAYHMHCYISHRGADVKMYANKIERAEAVKITDKKRTKHTSLILSYAHPYVIEEVKY